MTHDNQVIKMRPFSSSDTLPLLPHLNNKSTLECFLRKKKKGWGKKILFVFFRLNLSLYLGVKMGIIRQGAEGGKGLVKSASARVKVPDFLNSSLRNG